MNLKNEVYYNWGRNSKIKPKIISPKNYNELKKIINECIENSNNQDLRTILDCLAEIGHDVTRPTEPTRR